MTGMPWSPGDPGPLAIPGILFTTDAVEDLAAGLYGRVQEGLHWSWAADGHPPGPGQVE